MNKNQILKYLAEYLEIDQFSDYCVNGLQIEGKSEVKKIVTGVSVSMRFIEAAIAKNADMLIVHHGLFWKGTPHPFVLKGSLRKRVHKILTNDLSLAAYHLPLDAHPVIGNNAELLKALGCEEFEQFGVGASTTFSVPITADDLESRLNKILPEPCVKYNYGPSEIKKLAVVTGGADGLIEKAFNNGADAYISGEISEPTPRLAEELGIHYFQAGHYNTERFGPLAIAAHLQEHFGISSEFIDIPNPA